MINNQKKIHSHANASPRKFILAGVFCLLGLPLVAGAQMNSTDAMPAAKASMQGSVPMSDGKPMDMKKSMEGMQQKMFSIPMTGDTDHDFAMMMKEHHQGAMDMAQAELKQGKDPQLHKMAMKIISAQKKEIAEFDAWLKKHEASMGAGQSGK